MLVVKAKEAKRGEKTQAGGSVQTMKNDPNRDTKIGFRSSLFQSIRASFSSSFYNPMIMPFSPFSDRQLHLAEQQDHHQFACQSLKSG